MVWKRTHIKLTSDRILLISGSQNRSFCLRFLTGPRKWIMRGQPWIAVKWQPLNLFKKLRLFKVPHSWDKKTPKDKKPRKHNNIEKKKNRKKKNETFEMGLVGWIRVHLGRMFAFAQHIWQSKPESQLLSLKHVCPSCC